MGERPWWQRPFGVPPVLERHWSQQNARPLARWEVIFGRLSIPLFEIFVAIVATTTHNWGLWVWAAFPFLQLFVFSPDPWRRQILGRPPRD
jgi:cyanate permease